MAQYRIIRGRIRKPRAVEGKKPESHTPAQWIDRGETIDSAEWSEQDIRSWLADGIIAPLDVVDYQVPAGPPALDMADVEQDVSGSSALSKARAKARGKG